jgi:PAS domain S-box-containing protein
MLSLPEPLARSALDAAPDAMIIVDEAGIVRFANRQASALFGYPHEEIVGTAVEQLMPERFRDRHAAHRRDYTAALRLRPMGVGVSLVARRRDGREVPVEISLSPIQGGGEPLVAALRTRLGGDLKAVLMTGDTSTVVKAMHDDPHLCIASKPVKAEALLALMRGLLEDGDNSARSSADARGAVRASVPRPSP